MNNTRCWLRRDGRLKVHSRAFRYCLLIALLVVTAAVPGIAVGCRRDNASEDSPASFIPPAGEPRPSPVDQGQATANPREHPETDGPFRVAQIDFGYPFGPVPLGGANDYRPVFLGPEAGHVGEVLIRFTGPPAQQQTYSHLWFIQAGLACWALPKGSVDPIFEAPAHVEYYFDADGLHISGLPSRLILLRVPGETCSASGEPLGEDAWIWLSDWYFSPFHFVDTLDGFANLPKFRGDGRRVGVAVPSGGVRLRSSPKDSAATVVEVLQATNFLLEDSPDAGWLKATLFRVVDDGWRGASVSSLDDLLSKPFVERLTGYLRAEEVFEIPEPLNQGGQLAVIRSSGYTEDGSPLPATAAILPTCGSYGWPVRRMEAVEAALRGTEAIAMGLSITDATEPSYLIPAYIKGKWVSFLSWEHHLPVVAWSPEEVSEFWEIWDYYKNALSWHVSGWRVPEELAPYLPDLVHAFDRALAAHEAWVEWGISFAAENRGEPMSSWPNLDVDRFLDLLVERMDLSAQEEALLRKPIEEGVQDLEEGADPAEEAFKKMTVLLANDIIGGQWRPPYMEEAQRLMVGG